MTFELNASVVIRGKDFSSDDGRRVWVVKRQGSEWNEDFCYQFEIGDDFVIVSAELDYCNQGKCVHTIRVCVYPW